MRAFDVRCRITGPTTNRSLPHPPSHSPLSIHQRIQTVLDENFKFIHRGYVDLPYPLYLASTWTFLGLGLGLSAFDWLSTVWGHSRGTTHKKALGLALALVTVFPSGVSASLDGTAVRRRVLSTRNHAYEQTDTYLMISFYAQKIVLASLLGGVPALGILMLLGLCLWIRKRKRDLRRHALANGIELDSDGWPVDRNYTVTHDLELVARERAGGATPMLLSSRSVESKGASPPPPYHRPAITPPAPSYNAASSPAHLQSQSQQQQLLAVPVQAGPESSLTAGAEGTRDRRGIRQSIIGVAM